MCQQCGQEIGRASQIDFLKRYLQDQTIKLEQNPDNAELVEEVEKTRLLLDSMQTEGQA